MTPDELQKLDADLATEEASLVARLHEIGQENPDVPGDTEPKMVDQGEEYDDRVNESTDLAVSVSLQAELDARLKEVRAARERIKKGVYGACAHCAQPIAKDRLHAVPTAGLCIACADRR